MRHLHRWALQGVFRRRYVRFRAVLFRRVVFFVTFFAVRFVLRVPPPTAFFTALTTVSSGLGVFFTGDAADAARYGTVTGHDLTLRNPKHVPIEELPGVMKAA